MSTYQAEVSSRAVVFRAPRSIEVTRAPVPAPGAGQVRVRLEGCGVCGSNLPVWEGRPWLRYPLYPGAPGHEGWGRIDAVGEGVTDLAVGERVAMVSYNAYADYDLADADAVVKLPASLDGQPFPGEALGCVMNIFRRSGIRSGQTVAIVGIGFLGAALCALAAGSGARVIAISRREFALGMAERLGARAVVRLSDPARSVREVRRIVGAAGCERVIEAVGTQEALDIASELTGIRARLIIAGYHQDGPRRIDLQQWNLRGLDVINAHERDVRQYRRGLQEAVEQVAGGRFDPSCLYTHTFALEEASEAFAALSSRPPGFLKALITCT